MNKIIVLTAVTTILLATSQSKAWAGNQARHDDDGYYTFRKIVHVLDDLINDDYRRGRTQIVVKEYIFPKRKVCYYKGPYEICEVKEPRGRGRGQNYYLWKQPHQRGPYKHGR